MRLWSLHPSYLDTKGLVALWREGLLAQKVLQGDTKGYKNHPQLQRFKETKDPLGAIAKYLHFIVDEADTRGYNFDRTKLADGQLETQITVTKGQLDYELQHLLNKLATRDPLLHNRLSATKRIKTHPIFVKIKGDVEVWEKV